MNAEGDRWTRLGIDLGPLMRSLRTGGRGGGIILTGWNFTSASSSPPSTPFLLPVSLLIYGLDASPPPIHYPQCSANSPWKIYLCQMEFYLGLGINAVCKRCFNHTFLNARVLQKKFPKIQAGVMKMFLSFLMRAHSNWSRFGNIWWKEKLSWEGSARWWRTWGVL